MGNRILLLLKFLLLLCVTMVHAETNTGKSTKQMTLFLTNATSLLPYSPQRLLDPGWSDTPSVLACAFKSVANFDESKGFIYNNTTKICTPILWLTETNTSRQVTPEDGQLFLQRDVCQDDFLLYNVGTDGTKACIKLQNVAASYTEATAICNTWGGHLAAVKTFAKLELVRALAAGQSMWIGLDDTETEGEFIWQIDNKEMTTEEERNVFAPGEPNDGDEDETENCVIYAIESTMLNDVSCSGERGFVCEIFLP